MATGVDDGMGRSTRLHTKASSPKDLRPESGEPRGTADGRPPRRVSHFFLPKIPEPLVWVAIAVWSHEGVLLVLASHPPVFGAFG